MSDDDKDAPMKIAVHLRALAKEKETIDIGRIP